MNLQPPYTTTQAGHALHEKSCFWHEARQEALKGPDNNHKLNSEVCNSILSCHSYQACKQ